MTGKVTISLDVNGQAVQAEVGTDTLLLDFLRGTLGLTGTKEGCGVGVCGTCTVLLDDRLVSSCLLPAVLADGRQVRTVEGLAGRPGAADGPEAELGELQQAFIAHEGMQCGICTSGQLVSATALLQENPRPSSAEIQHWMAGNLCRCTGYQSIQRAIRAAAGEEAEGEDAGI